MDGMAIALAKRSYADTTIADIARESRVSKRTFYETFRDKEECFLATYTAFSDELLRRIAVAVATPLQGEPTDVAALITAAVQAYFDSLQEHASIMKPFFTDVQSAGPAALKLRREIHHRFADTIVALVQSRLVDFPQARLLSPLLANAVVGGVNELVLMAIEEDRAAHVSELAPVATELLMAVLAWNPDAITPP